MIKGRQKSALGIHLSESSIRLTEITRDKGELFLSGLGYGLLTDGSLSQGLSGGDQAKRAEIADVAKSTADSYEINTRQAVCSIGGGLAFIKEIPIEGLSAVTMPSEAGKASEEEIQEQVMWEAGQLLISPVQEYSIDFHLSKGRVFIVGFRRRLIDSCVDIFRRAGIELVAVDVDAFALFNLGEFSGKLSSGKTVALLSMEESSADIVIVQGGALASVGTVLYHRDVVIEAHDQLSREDDPIRRICGKVSTRMKRMGFHKSQVFALFRFDRVILSGGFSQSPGGAGEILASKLGCPVEAADPFKGLNLGKLPSNSAQLLQRRGTFAVAIGLAYRGISEC